ncbi:unnamed protein product [Toxocara canis]|uniref:OrfB_Zn_ribbon domain-containing protein n=1 Tax=Toxocara canis TaxID=6265 RepID=A0A183UI26_TOXCA|nr:unnamed protein product [Toxocara canis]
MAFRAESARRKERMHGAEHLHKLLVKFSERLTCVCEGGELASETSYVCWSCAFGRVTPHVIAVTSVSM